MAHNGFRIIEARRRLEERQRDIETSMAAERRAIRLADFENTTALKIEQRTAKVNHFFPDRSIHRSLATPGGSAEKKRSRAP